MNLLDLDARWRRFNDQGRACPCCGKTFSGIFDLGYDHPDDWPHGHSNGEDIIVGDDRLNADLCRIGDRHFLRCTLPLTIRGSDEFFAFGPWAEVSQDQFYAYLDTYGDTPKPMPEGEGLLANALPMFEDESGTVVRVALPDPTNRPELTAQHGALVEAQENGISFDDLLDIYAAGGQDIRPHLTQD